MRYSVITSLALAFASLAQATFSSPKAGDSWPVEQEQDINWDTTGLTGPCDIHLVPAGATDLTVIVETIVLQTANKGTFKWAPPKTINVREVVIIIIDATKKIVKSEEFIIIIIIENVR